MLVYLKLLFQNENIVVYEYGLTEEKMIGKVIVSLHNKKDCQFFSYSENYKSFNVYTGCVITKIFHYIAENRFPKQICMLAN